MIFDVPENAADLGLIVTHGLFPGVLIIDAPESFLHAPTILKLTKLERDGCGESVNSDKRQASH